MKALMEIEEAVREEAASGGTRPGARNEGGVRETLPASAQKRGSRRTPAAPSSERVREGHPSRVRART